MTLGQDESVSKAEELSLKAQCVFGFAKVAKKLRERLSAFEIVARSKVSEAGKLRATWSKQKKDDVENEVKQMHMILDAQNSHVAEMKLVLQM